MWIKSVGWTDFQKYNFWANNCRGFLYASHKVTVELPSPPNSPVPVYGEVRELKKNIVGLFWTSGPLEYVEDRQICISYYPESRDRYEPHELQLEMRVIGPCEIVVTESMIYSLEYLSHVYVSLDEGTTAYIDGEWVPVPYGFHAHYAGLNGEFEPLCYKVTSLPW